MKKFFCDLYSRILDDDIPALSSYLAYALLISFFPFIIFLLTIISLFPIEKSGVIKNLSSILPKSAYDLVYKVIIEILSSSTLNLLSFSIIITIYTASGGFRAVIRGLNKAYDEIEKRSVIKIFLISIICTVGIIFIIIASFLLQIFSLQLEIFFIRYMKFNGIIEYATGFSKYLILFLSSIFIFSFIYKYTPSRKIKWVSVLPGALFSTISWILSSFFFSFYVNNFSNYAKFYGSIAAVFILLAWLYIVSALVLIGGEINAVLTFIKEGKIKTRCKKY